MNGIDFWSEPSSWGNKPPKTPLGKIVHAKFLEVKGGDGVFTASASSTEAKPVHILTVQFTPGKEGEFVKTLHVVTDLKEDSQVDLKVKGSAK